VYGIRDASACRVGLPIDASRRASLNPTLSTNALGSELGMPAADVAGPADSSLTFSPAAEAPTMEALLATLPDVPATHRAAFVAAVASDWASAGNKYAVLRLARHAQADADASPLIAEGLARAAMVAREPGRAALLAVAAAKAIAPGTGPAFFARLGRDAAVELTRALGLDAKRLLAVSRSVRADVADVPVRARVDAAVRLVVEAKRAGDVAVVATVFATFDARAVRGDLPAALASAIGGGDRMATLLASKSGRRLVFARGGAMGSRLSMLDVVRRGAWTALPAEPWTNPALMQAAFVDRAADVAALRGDAPVVLAGTDLENTIGVALGVTPAAPRDASAAEAAAAEGRFDYFAEEPARSIVQPVAAAIRAAGGSSSGVTVVPIQVSSADVGLVQTSLFRVGEGASARFVDDVGRTYASFEDWSSANVLPPGLVTYPAGGRVGAALESRATPRTVDTAGEFAVEALDAAAMGGGLVAGGLTLVGSGGTAAPLVAMAAGAWEAGRSAGALSDRWVHGQSIDPLSDAAARAAWLEVAAGAVGVGALVSGAAAARFAATGARGYALARATASATNAAAFGFDAAAAFDAGHALLTRWDRLAPAQRASLFLSLGFWGVQAGMQARLRRPFDVGAHREALAGSVDRPSVETAKALRSRGYRDTLGMSGEADVASPRAHLRAIARGQALAESLGGRALERIRGIFEPSAALRREREVVSAELASISANGEMWRAHAKEAGARTEAETALVARFETVSARLDSVDKRIAADLRVRRVASRKEGAEVMRGFLDSLEASGVPRGEAERMAGEVRMAKETARALEAGGVSEETLRGWLADFFQLTTKTRAPGELRIEVKAERARYVDGERTVDLGRDFVNEPQVEQRRRLFHELAHSIESQDPTIGKASVEWVRQRAESAGSTDPVDLATLTGLAGYRGERALEDHFVDAYVGKLYEGVPVSEVASMAMEKFIDPKVALDLFREDPEHFFFFLGVMR
jgi:hypothetical protein